MIWSLVFSIMNGEEVEGPPDIMRDLRLWAMCRRYNTSPARSIAEMSARTRRIFEIADGAVSEYERQESSRRRMEAASKR